MATPAGGLADRGGGGIIGMYVSTIMSKASNNNQSLDRAFQTTNDRGTPASARGLAAGAAVVVVFGGW
jgi:hypothetical protein